jgi:hypothetical protein
VQTVFPAWDVRAEACADSPAWAVIKQVDTWQPDLVVVGSHGRSAVGRWLLGSVWLHSLAGTSRSGLPPPRAALPKPHQSLPSLF